MKNKLISLLLVGVLLLAPATVFADSQVTSSSGSVAEDISNEIKVGKDIVQGVESAYSGEISTSIEGEECQAYITKTSSFSVVIPKTIILDGSAEQNNSAEYSIRLKGDLGGSQIVKVVPDASFAFKQEGKTDVTATVSQDITSFQLGDGLVTEDLLVTGVETTGTVSVEKISAGSWAGSFKFNISMEDEVEVDEDENQATLSTFSFEGNEFSFEENMTWAEWLESEYCTDENFMEKVGPSGDVLAYMVDEELLASNYLTYEGGEEYISMDSIIVEGTLTSF